MKVVKTKSRKEFWSSHRGYQLCCWHSVWRASRFYPNMQLRSPSITAATERLNLVCYRNLEVFSSFLSRTDKLANEMTAVDSDCQSIPAGNASYNQMTAGTDVRYEVTHRLPWPVNNVLYSNWVLSNGWCCLRGCFWEHVLIWVWPCRHVWLCRVLYKRHFCVSVGNLQDQISRGYHTHVKSNSNISKLSYKLYFTLFPHIFVQHSPHS